MLAHAGLAALVYRCQNGRGGIDAGKDIGDRHAVFLRLTVGFTGDRHQAGHALDDEIIARAMRIGAVLPETGDRTIDQLGELLGQAGVIHPVFGKPAGFEILDQDVGIGQKLFHLGLTFIGGQIDNNRGFAPVGRMEIRRGFIFPALNERRPPLAGVVARRAFDLDHLAAEIRKRLTGPRACQNTCQLNNLEPCQRGRHYSSSAASMISFISA